MLMGFPRKSIEAVFALAKLQPHDIDYVAIASKRGHFLNEYAEFDAGTFGIDRGVVKNLFMSVGSGLSSLRNDLPVLEKLYYGLREPVYEHRRKAINKVLHEEFAIQCPIEFIEHHFAHACSAFYSSGYDDALIVTMDASGDGSSYMSIIRDGKWEFSSSRGKLRFACQLLRLCDTSLWFYRWETRG